LNYLLTGVIAFFLSNDLFAKSILSIAKSVEKKGAKIGFQVGIIGLIIAGAYYALGKPEAHERFSKAAIGLGIISMVTVIANTIKSWVG
jgi:hypothetical protein